MITDINGVEINIGDEVYASLSNRIYKIKIVKETDRTIHYCWKLTKGNWIPKGLKDGDWSNKTYMLKSSQSFKGLLKVC